MMKPAIHAFVYVLAALFFGQTALAESALVTAIKTGDPDSVNLVIRQGADVNAPEKDGTNPLQWAVYQDNADIVAALLNTGADASQPNREGMTPLILAAQAGNADIARRLLDAGAAVNQTLLNGETPLMMAARTGDLETLQILLDRGAAINARENLRGTTAIMWAAANRNADAIRLLLDNGAEIRRNSGTMPAGSGPYLAPTARERIWDFYHGGGLVGDSLENSEDVSSDENLEIRVSRAELVSRLPESLVQDFMENPGSDLPAEFLLLMPPVGGKDWGGLSALHFAVREGDLASVRVLVEAGADINQLSEFGWTPLLTATQNRYYQIGKYLLDHGANPNIANEGGWNPLYIATDNRNIEAGDYPTRKPDMDHLAFIRLLLDHGADPNLRMASSTETRTIFTHQWLREEGATPFLRAAQSSDLTLMKLLLEYGADPFIPTSRGVTPLMVAAGIGWVEGVTFEWSESANEETLRLLLELGLDPNLQDSEDHRTALMGAAHKGRNYAIQILADAGADFALRDIGSRDSIHLLSGTTWQAIDYAEGLVRVGVQSAESHSETSALIRQLMLERGLEVPPEGRTLDSICVVDICK